MVYRRGDRGETWYGRPKLPQPFGRIGPYAYAMDRKTAEAMDAMLHQLALDRPEAIVALVEGRYTVADLYVAYRLSKGGQDRIRALVENANDPTIREAVAEYEPHCEDARTGKGLKQLAAVAGSRRLSWLAGKNISALYASEMARGNKPNSVRRGVHRAVVELLKHNFGDSGRRERMDGVRIPFADDSRAVQVESEKLNALIGRLDEVARLHVLALILTAVDVSPLGRIQVRHFDEERGTAQVPDRKTKARPRTLLLSADAQTVFRLSAQGKAPGDRLFPLSSDQLTRRFKAAREAAGLDRIPIDMERTKYSALRLKDLRHLLPTALDATGAERERIQLYIGHTPGSRETSRYITPRGDRTELDRATASLGLTILRAG